jgi:16S rRNA (guanine527-N7)-methyltransferase
VTPELERQLRSAGAEIGITPDNRLVAGLTRYLDLLLLWNRRVNLTAIRDPADIVLKHFVDSLAVLPFLPVAARSVVDVGSGAGFPGAVIALARPDLLVALVESVHKKAAFLEALRRELPLPNVTVHAKRAEDAGVTADIAISRATWDVPGWLDRGRAFVFPGGALLGMEGAELHKLPPGATRHRYNLGGSARAIVVFHVER